MLRIYQFLVNVFALVFATLFMVAGFLLCVALYAVYIILCLVDACSGTTFRIK